MRVFIYEYTWAACDRAAASLRAEGWAMLAAALEDFGQLPGLEVVTMGREPLPFQANQLDQIIPTDREEETFRVLARSADFSLVIAPEFDDLLWRRCSWVEESGGRLLGPSSTAVRLTGDKLALAQHLRRRRVLTPECQPDCADASPTWSYPLVWKPRFGAGSRATFLIRNADEWPRCREAARAEGWQGESLIQPWVPGQPASVAMLIGPRQCVPLVPVTQELSEDGRFHYLGGRIPLAEPLAARAIHLALQAAATVPELAGYVGVDVILGDDPDGSQDHVIEINPRLTTSYVGLRAFCRFNLAEAMLQAVHCKEIPPLQWHSGTLQFSPSKVVLSASSKVLSAEC